MAPRHHPEHRCRADVPPRRETVVRQVTAQGQVASDGRGGRGGAQTFRTRGHDGGGPVLVLGVCVRVGRRHRWVSEFVECWNVLIYPFAGKGRSR